MNMEQSKLVAELLAKYAEAALSVIGEKSGSIEEDAEDLKDEITKYAKALEVSMPNDDIWKPYILSSYLEN